MIVGEDGVGYTHMRGDYVARPEWAFPHGTPVRLNWRIEDIRPNELVLVRQPEQPTARSLVKVLAVRPYTMMDTRDPG